MNRGELYLVRQPGQGDPKKQCVYLVVSRQILIDSKFPTVICAPVYSRHAGLSTQVSLGVAEGMKHESSVHCDELFSVSKTLLTRFVGRLNSEKLAAVDSALSVALDIDE